MRPTAAGAALANHAEGILARMEAAEAEVAAIAGVRGGRLRIASFPTAGATLMPLAIATFRASHPGVELTLAEGEPEEIAPRLRAGEFDLALLFEFPGSARSSAPGCAASSCSTTRCTWRCRNDHPLAEAPGAAARGPARGGLGADLGGEPLRRHVVRSCHAAGFEPSVSFESDDYQTVQGLVAAGVGVALIPQLALSTVRDDIRDPRAAPAQPGAQGLRRDPPRGAPSPPAVATMLDVLREASRRAPGRGRLTPKRKPPPGLAGAVPFVWCVFARQRESAAAWPMGASSRSRSRRPTPSGYPREGTSDG